MRRRSGLILGLSLGVLGVQASPLAWRAESEWARIRRWWPEESRDAEARRLELALSLNQARQRADVPPAEIDRLVAILEQLEDDYCDRRDHRDRASQVRLEPERAEALRRHLREHRRWRTMVRVRRRLGAKDADGYGRGDGPKRQLDPFLPVSVCRYR